MRVGYYYFISPFYLQEVMYVMGSWMNRNDNLQDVMYVMGSWMNNLMTISANE